jgi:type I restriction enzyme S subunit
VELQKQTIATLKELKAATMAKLFREGLRGEPLKQTEIGEIPKSWEVARLDAIADLVSGGTPSKTRPEWWQGPIPWASPKDMKQSRLWDTQDHISADALESGSRLVPAKTLFIVIRGMILAKDVPVAMTQVPMAFNQDMKAVLPSSTVDAEYLLYAISSQKRALTLEIGTSAHGTRRVGTSSLEALLVPLPSKEEQLEIATTLGVFEQRETVASRLQTTLKTFFSSMLHVLMTGRVRVTPKMIALQRAADRAARRAKWSGKVDEKVLEQVVKRIVEAIAPEKIILFGSAARGEMGPDSDLDLLIVKSDVHRLATAQMIEHSLTGIPIPTDIVVATPKDIEVHKDTIGLIYRPALQEGKILYAA